MDCPRCGEPDPPGPECPRCGVILAKARPRRGSGVAFPGRREPAPSRRTSSLILALVGAGAVAWAAWRVVAPAPQAADPPPSTGSAPTGPPSPAASPSKGPEPALLAPSSPPVPDEPLVLPPSSQAAEALARDQVAADRLSILLATGRAASSAHVEEAQGLYDRHGAPVAPLLEGILLNAASQAQQARRFDQAIALLRRAADVSPGSVHPLRGHVAVLSELGDWADVEVSARAGLRLAPGDVALERALAQALVRMDRSAEAIEVLEDSLERHADPMTRALLQRVLADQAPETGLREQRIAHFHVRYDGDTHEAVGREVLRVLDRHYATLVRTYDHRPGAPIPVILLSRESYYTETGAPAWSGGRYDSFDGRIRLPIGGLSASLTPKIDETLIHELTHAFVHDISRGVAPRMIHEGLAQMAEGKRVEDLLTPQELEALAEGRLRGAGGFYVASLSFTQHLMAQRGQGGINDLLVAMAETGDANAAFEQVYRRDLAGLQRDWETRLRHRYAR